MPRPERNSVIEENPTRQSIKLGDKYVNLSALGRLTGIDASYLSRIFSGSRVPRIAAARKIASAIGIGLEELLDALEGRREILRQETAGGVMKTTQIPHDGAVLLQVVGDFKRSWVDRGEAVDKLCESGMTQKKIAGLSNCSTATVNHVRTCFLYLQEEAREMCKAGEINVDACYSLALAVKGYQDRVLRGAKGLCRIRDNERSKPLGRQTPKGQITDEDMKTAILDERHKC